jgi:hypothetical protein
VLVGGIVVGGLALAVALRLAGARRDLLLARSDLGAARTALTRRDVTDAAQSLDRAARHLSVARAALSGPVRAFEPFPVVGSAVQAPLAAVRAGRDGVDAGRILVAASASFPTSASAAVDGQDLSAFHDAAVRSQAAVTEVDRRLDDADHALSGPSSAALPPVSRAAKAMRAELDKSRQVLTGASRGLTLLSELSAPGAEARLLLLSQDSLELRATGGYIGTYGVLHFSHGTVTLETYDATSNLPAPDPPMAAPYELSKHLAGPWALSNSNWWPDFPTSAAAAGEMFRRQGGGQVDGVLGLTELATARLLGALGPVQLPGYSAPVTEQGFDTRVVYEVELKRPLDDPRKKFLVELSNAVFDHLFHLPADKVPAIADSVARSIGAGDIQLWFADAAREAELAGTAVAGRLPTTDGDMLMVVDANMTASKANLNLHKVVQYRVDRGADGRLVGHVRVELHNDGPKTAINPLYDSYLRIYAPAGSRLLGSVPGQDAQAAADGPYEVFGDEVVVPAMGTVVATFDYALPERVSARSRYDLTWIRQAGTPADELVADVGGGRAHFEPNSRLLRVVTRAPR